MLSKFHPRSAILSLKKRHFRKSGKMQDFSCAPPVSAGLIAMYQTEGHGNNSLGSNFMNDSFIAMKRKKCTACNDNLWNPWQSQKVYLSLKIYLLVLSQVISSSVGYISCKQLIFSWHDMTPYNWLQIIQKSFTGHLRHSTLIGIGRHFKKRKKSTLITCFHYPLVFTTTANC